MTERQVVRDDNGDLAAAYCGDPLDGAGRGAMLDLVAVTLAAPIRKAFRAHFDEHRCDEGDPSSPHYIGGFIHCPEAARLWGLLPDGDRVAVSAGCAEPPWRLGIPVVPDSVTALSGAQGTLWLRQESPPGFDAWGGSWWACLFTDGTLGPTAHITDIVSHAPLVETADPRGAA